MTPQRIEEILQILIAALDAPHQEAVEIRLTGQEGTELCRSIGALNPALLETLQRNGRACPGQGALVARHVTIGWPAPSDGDGAAGMRWIAGDR